MHIPTSKSNDPDYEPNAGPEPDWLANAGKVLRFAAKRAGEKKLTQVAASLTFTTVLAIVPLLAVVLSLFTAFPLFAEFKVALENFLTTNLMPSDVSDTVMSYLNQFAAQASRLTAIGSLFLIITSIMLLVTVDEAFNDIWHVQHQRRWRQRILVYWAIISIGPILAGASLWATSLLASESLNRVGELSGVFSVALSLVPLLVTSVGFAALFMGVPHRRVNWKDAFAGGLGTAIVLEAMKAGFAYYLTSFPSYKVIYGAFATLPIFLLWIYLSWLAILFGATVAATLPLLRLRRWAENRQPGSAFISAINVIRQLDAARDRVPPGRSAHYLSTQLRLQQEELYNVLNTLKDLGYIVCYQAKKDDIWVLTCNPDQTRLEPVIDALLIDRNQSSVRQDPLLIEAVSASLTQARPVMLTEIIGSRVTLSETTDMVQNTIMVPHEPPTSGDQPC